MAAVEDTPKLLLALAGHAQHVIGRLGGCDRDLRVVRDLAARVRPSVDPHPLDVNRVVRRLEPRLRGLLPDGMVLSVAAAAPRARIVADRGDLEEAIVGLVANAAEASGPGGVIRVDTANVAHDRSLTRRPDAGEAAFVLVAVSDAGAGIAPEHRDRVFEPLFTTKQGHAGFGLPVALALVRQLGGDLSLHSEPGRGTAASLYLPLADRVLEELGTAPVARGGTVLVVDDADAVRRWTREVLEHVGYRTLEASNGVEAVELARTHEGPLDLVVSDVVMPELDGIETIAAIAELRPDTRYVLMSGYAESGAAERGVERHGALFLEKPFSLRTLCGTVRDALQTV